MLVVGEYYVAGPALINSGAVEQWKMLVKRRREEGEEQKYQFLRMLHLSILVSLSRKICRICDITMNHERGGGLPPAGAAAAAVSDDEDMDHDGIVACFLEMYESVREAIEYDRTAIPRELVVEHGNEENLLAYLRHKYEEACEANEKWKRIDEVKQKTAELKRETAELKQETAELEQECAELDEMTAELKEETAELDAKYVKLDAEKMEIKKKTQKMKKLAQMIRNGQIKRSQLPDEFLNGQSQIPDEFLNEHIPDELINAKNAKSSQGDN